MYTFPLVAKCSFTFLNYITLQIGVLDTSANKNQINLGDIVKRKKCTAQNTHFGLKNELCAQKIRESD